MQSIRENVTDIDLVDQWIIVDDHTPARYHTRVKQALDWVSVPVEWIWKTTEPRGHAHSMNLLRERAQYADYVFHWEDDWKVFIPDRYVTRLIQGLQRFPHLGQILINEHYREQTHHPHYTTIEGGIPLDDHVIQHVWNPHDMRVGAFYWPHYSLRPGMQRGSLWNIVGPYDEHHAHFELEYANRYFHTHGFQTGFLKGIHAKHLGKCTWESEQSHPSAYALNNVTRFEQ